MAIQTAMRMGAEGIKIKVGGRLGGAEIARTEEFKQGRTPLHTLPYGHRLCFNTYAMTVYGKIGIKVWICKGEVLGKRDLNPNFSSGAADRRGGEAGGRSEGFRGGDRGDRRGGGGERREGGGGGDRRREGAGGGGNRGGGGGRR